MTEHPRKTFPPPSGYVFGNTTLLKGFFYLNLQSLQIQAVPQRSEWRPPPPRLGGNVTNELSFFRRRSADDSLFLFFSFLYDLHDSANSKNSSDLYLIIFARLVAIRIRRNSPVAFSNPRRWCCLHPLFFWSSPCSGSTNPWRFI